MPATYHTPGLTFQYPSDWELSEEQSAEGLSISLSGDGSAFCSLTLLPDRPSAESAVEAALAAYRESYDDFDVYPVSCRIAARDAVGRDIEFFCMELVNTAWIRALRTGRFTVLILGQSGPDEQRAAKRVFDTICRTLDCDAGVTVDERA